MMNITKSKVGQKRVKTNNGSQEVKSMTGWKIDKTYKGMEKRKTIMRQEVASAMQQKTKSQRNSKTVSSCQS